MGFLISAIIVVMFNVAWILFYWEDWRDSMLLRWKTGAVITYLYLLWGIGCFVLYLKFG